MQAVPISPAAVPESSLNKPLQDVQRDISTGEARMKVLSDTKPEGWEVELAYLREKDRQLREEKLLLLRKADT